MLARCWCDRGGRIDETVRTSEAELTDRAVMFLMTVEGMLGSPDQAGLLNKRLQQISTPNRAIKGVLRALVTTLMQDSATTRGHRQQLDVARHRHAPRSMTAGEGKRSRGGAGGVT